MDIQEFREKVLPKYEKILDDKGNLLKEAEEIRRQLYVENSTVPKELLCIFEQIKRKRNAIRYATLPRIKSNISNDLCYLHHRFRVLSESVYERRHSREMEVLKEVHDKLRLLGEQ